MSKKTRHPNMPRRWWDVGMRVSRMRSEEVGTIVEVNGRIKVKWDGGQTSYFKRGDRSNVKLELVTPPR